VQHSAAFRIQVIELLTLDLAGVSCRGPEQTATATVAAFMTETSAILFRKPASLRDDSGRGPCTVVGLSERRSSEHASNSQKSFGVYGYF
jgi:hypothetical protein